MSRLFRGLLALIIAAAVVREASAFSLLGPFEAYQVPALSYGGGDIGGPMNLGEEYRWNAQTITFGFDESFLNYFGAAGTASVMQAIAILNALPPVSAMSSNLAEFPLDTRRVNFQASALNLLDLKSTALSFLVEELGLADPERYTWTLRDRTPLNTTTNFAVIRRNFDPVTWNPSSYVNGVLYTYFIFDSLNPQVADAVENLVDPLSFSGSAVATTSLTPGQFYIGLTRDDVGGLRYLLRPNNYNVETLVAGTTNTSIPPPPGSPAGTPPLTNAIVNQALRPGVNKINFVPGRYDSLLGQFITMTNAMVDKYVTNSTLLAQNVLRVVAQNPEILFSAEDLGVNGAGFPVVLRRTAAAAPNWVNNNAINGTANLAGPGVIGSPGTSNSITPITITFSKVGPYIINRNPGFLDELNPFFVGFIWGSFDGSTNPPVVYPNGTSIQDLELQVLNPGALPGGADGAPQDPGSGPDPDLGS